MDRREFSKVMGAVVAGMVAGSRAFAEEKTPAAGKKAADTKDKDAVAARKALQSVLDDHKALAGHPVDKQAKKQKKAQQRKRAQRRQAAEKAT